MAQKRKRKKAKRKPPAPPPSRRPGGMMTAIALLVVIGIGVFVYQRIRPERSSSSTSTTAARTTPTKIEPQNQPGEYDRLKSAEQQHYTELELSQQPRIFHWFGGVPDQIRNVRLDAGQKSNIRRADYAGAESCKECHATNYEHWSQHPHRWMNAWASEETVRGDFSGDATMHYMGGIGAFYRDDGQPRMKLERDGVARVYSITRTIGSRFFQYYVGKLLKGPEPPGHIVRRIEHVLPFGYWFAQSEWVPIVNIEDESPDDERIDPFAGPASHQYDRVCSECHTTRPTGDAMLSIGVMRRIDAYSPRIIHFSAEEYLSKEHPELIASLAGHSRLSRQQMSETLARAKDLPADEHAVNLGISCEACHNGCAAHVENERELPAFFPVGPDVYLENGDKQSVLGRNSVNSNWVCSRCHAGNRVRYAAGISTWNSTEVSDASRGGCYDPMVAQDHGMQHLTCVHCHNPHKGIGQEWSLTADQDDASCINCHQRLRQPDARALHTHHPAGSSGDRCMNCHMPRINEGLQDVVRTHTIFSPTEPRMIEANQPNACNLCHVDQPIDWTLQHLKDWYRADGFSTEKISQNYPDRDKPVAVGWLASPHHGTRLVAADALIRAKADWAIEDLLGVLDDPYLVNRQFTARGLGKMLNMDLRDYGYRFYMFKKERAKPLSRMRELL